MVENIEAALNAVKLLRSVFSREYAFLMDELFTRRSCFNFDYDQIDMIVNSNNVLFENDSISLEIWPSYIFANATMELKVLNIDGIAKSGRRKTHFKTKLSKGVHKIEGRLGIMNKNGQRRWKSFEKEIYVHPKPDSLN